MCPLCQELHQPEATIVYSYSKPADSVALHERTQYQTGTLWTTYTHIMDNVHTHYLRFVSTADMHLHRESYIGFNQAEPLK